MRAATLSCKSKRSPFGTRSPRLGCSPDNRTLAGLNESQWTTRFGRCHGVAATNLELYDRPGFRLLRIGKPKCVEQLSSPAGVQGRYAGGQILKSNFLKPGFAHQGREFFLVGKLRNRIGQVLVSAA